MNKLIWCFLVSNIIHLYPMESSEDSSRYDYVQQVKAKKKLGFPTDRITRENKRCNSDPTPRKDRSRRKSAIFFTPPIDSPQKFSKSISRGSPRFKFLSRKISGLLTQEDIDLSWQASEEETLALMVRFLADKGGLAQALTVASSREEEKNIELSVLYYLIATDVSLTNIYEEFYKRKKPVDMRNEFKGLLLKELDVETALETFAEHDPEGTKIRLSQYLKKSDDRKYFLNYISTKSKSESDKHKTHRKKTKKRKKKKEKPKSGSRRNKIL